MSQVKVDLCSLIHLHRRDSNPTYKYELSPVIGHTIINFIYLFIAYVIVLRALIYDFF